MKGLLITCLLLLATVSLYAQERPASHPIIFKLSPLGLLPIESALWASGEYGFTNSRSIQLDLGYIYKPGLDFPSFNSKVEMRLYRTVPDRVFRAIFRHSAYVQAM